MSFKIKIIILQLGTKTFDMAYTISDKLDWIMIFIYEFGRKHGLTMKQAFNYLHRFQGMSFLDKHYDYVHTQSFKSMVDDITDYCHKKGGPPSPLRLRLLRFSSVPLLPPLLAVPCLAPD